MTESRGAAGIAEELIARTEWTSFRRSNGESAADVASMLVSVLNSDPETADVACDTLENAIAVQGNLFSAAEPVSVVLAAALADARPLWVKLSVLDLMYLILRGSPVADEIERGNDLLVERCGSRIRESLWLLVREALQDLKICRAALDVLELVEPDGAAAALVRSLRDVTGSE